MCKHFPLLKWLKVVSSLIRIPTNTVLKIENEIRPFFFWGAKKKKNEIRLFFFFFFWVIAGDRIPELMVTGEPSATRL